MKFKSRVQMLSYVIGKKPDIIKTIERRAEKEGVTDGNRLLDYKLWINVNKVDTKRADT
ncbi:hypothetical protein ACMDZ9_001293 [Enterococcus faecalis]